jgi:hypothetical protein
MRASNSWARLFAENRSWRELALDRRCFDGVTYGKSLPDFVVSAVFFDHTAALASILGPEEETTRFDHDGQLIWVC